MNNGGNREEVSNFSSETTAVADACAESYLREQGVVSSESKTIPRGVRLTEQDWQYVALFGGVSGLVKRMRLFAPEGPNKAKPRGEKGYFLPKEGT